MSGSSLWLPKHLRQAQMSKPIVFWFNRSRDFIMLPADPNCPPPFGYEKIECRHAGEVDRWSRLLSDQEKRIREMTDEERFNFEEPMRADMIAELRRLLHSATDGVNREFLETSIKMIEERREKQRKCFVESYMGCEAKEGVAS